MDFYKKNEYEMNKLLKEDLNDNFLLNSLEKEVLMLRFGLTEHGRLSIDEISKLLNINFDDMRNIEINAMKKFHKFRRFQVFDTYYINDDLKLSEFDNLEKIKNQINNMIILFSPIEQEALNLRYGLKDGKSRTIKEVSEILKIKEKKLKNILFESTRKLRGFVPYDSKNPNLISYEINDKIKKDLYKNLNLFNELEKVLLSLRFGFNGFNALPFDILSGIFNRTPGELIEIEMEAIEKYHKFISNK